MLRTAPHVSPHTAYHAACCISFRNNEENKRNKGITHFPTTNYVKTTQCHQLSTGLHGNYNAGYTTTICCCPICLEDIALGMLTNYYPKWDKASAFFFWEHQLRLPWNFPESWNCPTPNWSLFLLRILLRNGAKGRPVLGDMSSLTVRHKVTQS